MSQKGLLNENELTEQIQKYLDLKLDKDALIKPSKEVVKEIYKRFLDQTVKNWMKPKNSDHEPTISTRMLYWMRVITQRYNTGYDFNKTDLTMPTRKRNTAFLNIVLYVRALYDEYLDIYKQRESERAEQQEKNALINREIAKIRVEVDDLGFKIGQSEPIEQVKNILEEADRVLKTKKREVDEATEEKAKVKERIAKKEEMEARLRVEVEEVKRKNEENRRREELISKISVVREKLESTEGSLQQLKIHNDLKRAEEKRQLKMFDDAEQALVERITGEILNLQTEIRAIRDEKVEVKKRTDEDIRMTDETIRLFQQHFDELKERSDRDREDKQRNVQSVLQEYKFQLNNLLGLHEEPTQIEIPKNRTFIKSRDD